MQLALGRHLGRHVQQSGSDGPIAAGIQPAQMDIDMSLWLAIQRLKTPAKLAKRPVIRCTQSLSPALLPQGWSIWQSDQFGLRQKTAWSLGDGFMVENQALVGAY